MAKIVIYKAKLQSLYDFSLSNVGGAVFLFCFSPLQIGYLSCFPGGATSMNFDLWDGLMVIFSLTDGDGGQ